MVAVVDDLRRLRTAGSVVSLAQIGGEQALYRHADEIADSDAFDVAASALVGEWDTVDRAEASSLLLLGMREVPDPLAFANALETILVSSDVVSAMAPDIEQALIERAELRRDAREAHIAIDACDGLLRLVLAKAVRQFRFLDLVSDVAVDEEPNFASAIARRLGVVYLYFPDLAARTATREALHVLGANAAARADAEHELGAACLVDALESATADDVESAMRRARGHFSATIEFDSDRVDAQLYAAALDGVLALVDGSDPAMVIHSARTVREMALLRDAWRAPGRLSRWLGDDSAAEGAWWMLSEDLAAAAPQLFDDVWLNAAASLESIARGYRAARVARVLPNESPGLPAIVEPRLTSAFVRFNYRIQALSRWAEEIREDPELASAVAKLQELVDEPVSPSAVATAELRDQIPDPERLDAIFAAITSEQQALLERRLETLDGDESVLSNPIARRVGADIRAGLEGATDYEGLTKMFFNRIVDMTIRFVASRLDVEPGFAKGGWGYLADPDALEAQLQIDYYDFLKGSMLGDVVAMEARNTGGGRADVQFSLGATRIVAELKRDKAPVETGGIDSHLNQAGLYQSANVSLGLLLILDTSPKPQGQVRSLSQSVWLASKPALADGDVPRAIVTAVVSGNRPSPSGVS